VSGNVDFPNSLFSVLTYFLLHSHNSERIQMLDDIGFVWYPHVKKANSNHKKKDGKESGSSDEEDAKPGAK